MPVSGPVKGGARQKLKNEAGQFNITQPQAQARPCLRVLAARPGNLLERCFSVSGTELHFQFIGTEEKNDIRNVLQCHYRRQALEANKAYIKTSLENDVLTVHAPRRRTFLVCFHPAKKKSPQNT
jgi:hypothetical protein